MLQVLLTNDVIDSKLIQNFDSEFKNKIEQINQFLKESLIVKAKISRGDEVQFILKFDQSFFKNIIIFRSILFPIKVRTGSSLMSSTLLDTNSRTNSWNLNGSDFFLVRKLLDDDLKKEKNYALKFYSTLNQYDDILNSFFLLNDIIINNWNQKHWELCRLTCFDMDNKEIAKKLKLYSNKKEKPTQTYYDRLNKTNIEKIHLSAEYLINFFKSEGIIQHD